MQLDIHEKISHNMYYLLYIMHYCHSVGESGVTNRAQGEAQYCFVIRLTKSCNCHRKEAAVAYVFIIFYTYVSVNKIQFIDI